ncbi:MAG: bifunctional phosphoribosylaminoimidazolecarboxamide formyltransferase/IMP cyclohydrolase [Thermodesulfobacteriota bacterium]
MKKITRAVISVTDKSGIVEFARSLSEIGVEIISTGGTGELLKKEGIDVIPISSYTGFPEMLDGRVKTLHPKIYGGILGMRERDEHMKAMEEHGIPPIDMVVVNLYAFEKTVAGGCTLEEAIENIDIGGPTMLRAAAKNHRDVAVVTEPADYGEILEEMRLNDGALSPGTRFTLARKVFQLTARYDGAISNYLGTVVEGESRCVYPETFTVQFKKVQDLRYGENPHQSAAFFGDAVASPGGLAGAKQLQGKELSFNNIFDVDAALRVIREFHEPAAVIVKHNNPCGAAMSKGGILDAYRKALSCDPVSAFGGIISFNRVVERETAEELAKLFLEVIIAPGFDEKALEALKGKKNLRLLELPVSECFPPQKDQFHGVDMKVVAGGVLLQTPDWESAGDLKTATGRGPTEEELETLLFAWSVCKHVKSNAIVFAKGTQAIGIGAGQMSRIDSTRIAVLKANDAGLDTRNSVMASDAFFPFRDNVDKAKEAGVTAIIQPGGSVRDEEVIQAADEHGIAMVFTGMRHFRH